KEALMEERPILLISYPRSGNSLVRYILEALTRRTTGDDAVYRSRGDKTLLPIAEKAHHYNGYMECNYDKMLFLLRNYKEVIPRHAVYKNIHHAFTEELSTENRAGGYIHLLRAYDAWKKQKLLVYYEDLILD